MIVGVEIENGLCDRDHAFYKGWFVIHVLGLDIAYLPTLASATPEISLVPTKI